MKISRRGLKNLYSMQDLEPEILAVSEEQHENCVVETLSLRLGREVVRGILVRPLGRGPWPGIVYAHAHGRMYSLGASELTSGRPELLSPLGSIFAADGFLSVALDMPTFGDRSAMSEDAVSKAALWYGRSLFGQMLTEQSAAVSLLYNRADVLSDRIGMFGISMGATLAYFLAAVDTRIAAVAHLCSFADFEYLVEVGAHDLHGLYLIVPGLLTEASTGEIAGMVAPRPQLICVGDRDPLTPPVAVDRALAEARAVYAGGPLNIIRSPATGHVETVQMRRAVRSFFAETLSQRGQSIVLN